MVFLQVYLNLPNLDEWTFRCQVSFDFYALFCAKGVQKVARKLYTITVRISCLPFMEITCDGMV